MSSQEEQFGIAVIGMDGRFPGAQGIEALWDNLCAGRETIHRFRDEELDPSISGELRRDPAYVPARGILEDAVAFDAAFFGMTPREAELMDPQQRLFLELSWSALERAGYDPARFEGSIGVYAGMANNTYFLSSVLAHPDKVKQFGEFQTMLANEKDFLATRVSHKLDLRGPSISMYTGCSTSLVAVTQAFHALLSFQTDMALAGGVCITMPQNSGYLHREDGIEAVDGHCRPFDASATGTVFSNGAALVVLKRLEDAIRDSDHIHAVLVGAALNNDGAAKVGFAAPSVQGQAEVIADALAQGDVDPASMGFVEAHGTATKLGDPVEFEGLRQAFRYPHSGQQACALGSIKGNFGHLLAAAGVTGLIKAVLSVEEGVVPPTVNYKAPNPGIDFARSPFFMNGELVPFPDRGGPRRAGVSSFGIGGTNAHVIIEQAPPRADSDSSERSELLVLSARTEDALGNQVRRLADHLDANHELQMADVAYTLQVGRRAFPHRFAAVVDDARSAAETLRQHDSPRSASSRFNGDSPEILFVFPGVGSQYEGMPHGYYANDITFRSIYDECAATLTNLGCSVSSPTTGAGAGELAPPTLGSGNIDTDMFTLFVTEYALARTWMAWGVRPRALLGHSLGELVAACVSEVLRLDDALRYLVELARLAEMAPPGRMLAVRLGHAELESFFEAGSGLAVGADNSPSLSVASGTMEEIEALTGQLEGAGVPNRLLPSSRAFHSGLVHGIREGLLDVASELRYGRPRIPLVSSITGRWIDTQTVSDPSYWAGHAGERVCFREATTTALTGGTQLVLEVGPGSSLGTCVRQVAGKASPQIVQTLPDENTGGLEAWRRALMAVGRCWLAGCDMEWSDLHPRPRRRVCLPTYPFERSTHWLPARAAAQGAHPNTKA